MYVRIEGVTLADFITQHSCVPVDDVVELANNYVSLQPWILSFDGSRTQIGVGIRVTIISLTGKV